jgi:hypothetical protein
MPRLCCIHFRENSIRQCLVRKDFSTCKDHSRGELRILPKAFDCFNRISVSKSKGVLWPLIETKLDGLPITSLLRNGIYLLVESSNIVIGKPKLFDDLK